MGKSLTSTVEEQPCDKSWHLPDRQILSHCGIMQFSVLWRPKLVVVLAYLSVDADLYHSIWKGWEETLASFRTSPTWTLRYSVLWVAGLLFLMSNFQMCKYLSVILDLLHCNGKSKECISVKCSNIRLLILVVWISNIIPFCWILL